MLSQTLEFSQTPEQTGEKFLHKMGWAVKFEMDNLPSVIGPKGCYADSLPYDLNQDVEIQVLQIKIGDFETLTEQKRIEIRDINRKPKIFQKIEILSQFKQNDVSLKLNNIIADTVCLPLDMELSYLEINQCKINNLYMMSCPELRGKRGKGMDGYNDIKINGLSGTHPSGQTRFFCAEEQNPPEKLLAHFKRIRASRPPKSGPAQTVIFPEDPWYNQNLHKEPLDPELVKHYLAQAMQPA